MSINFFEDCIKTLPHGKELQVIDSVLFYSKSGSILCKAKTTIPLSMRINNIEGNEALSASSAIEYIAQAGAIARIIESKLDNQPLSKFGAIIKVTNLHKISPFIGLDVPLLIYAEHKKLLTNVHEVKGSLQDASSKIELARATFNVIEFN